MLRIYGFGCRVSAGIGTRTVIKSKWKADAVFFRPWLAITVPAVTYSNYK